MMNRILVTCCFLITCSSLACSKSTPAVNANLPVRQPDSQVSNTVNNQDEELLRQVRDIAVAARGRVGVAAMVFAADDAAMKPSILNTVFLNAHEHFPMQSVYKLPIGMAVMQQVDAGKIKLDQMVSVTRDDFIGASSHSPIRDKHPRGVNLTVNELMNWMLEESDGTASDVLMKLAGGPTAIQAYLSSLGIKDMIVLDTEKAFAQDHSLQYRNWTTPEAASALLRALAYQPGLSDASKSFLLKLMTDSRTGPNRLKGLLPAGTVVAHKTGTSGTENGVTAATNDIGIMRLPNGEQVIISVFVADSPANEQIREAVIAKIAKAVWDKWSK